MTGPECEEDWFRSNEIPFRERTAADHDEPWQYQPYHLTDREKLGLLKRRERMIGEEWDAQLHRSLG